LPAEGERRAQRGYTRQYSEAAAAIYAELDRGQLRWVGLAHKSAGILDDLVLGYEHKVVGHQFKMSRYADRFALTTILMGANGLLEPAARSWQGLRKAHPGATIFSTLVTNDFPSTADAIGSGDAAHSAAFLVELEQYPERTIEEWYSTRWQNFIRKIQKASGLFDEEFAEFWSSFRLLHGSAADFALLHKLSPDAAEQAQQIADLIPRLVADPKDIDTWTRAEFLDELGWRDPGTTLHSHVFPVGAYVQRNVPTERALRNAISGASCGYVALVGPPGVGKSTLLQTALATESGLRVVRYLAYIPGAAQGVGRGEAEDFLAEVCTQLRNSGLTGIRFRNESLTERRQQFGEMIRQASLRYERDGIRTLIVIDGLDHIPREEHPQHSLLAELPLPDSVPPGVLFVLGTQLLELVNLKPAVRDQAGNAGRLVHVSALLREDVRRIADAFTLDPEVSRERLYELSQGHPLVTRYLIVALRDANPESRAKLLQGAVPFEGDIQTVYASAWRGIENDADAQEVLGYLARTEGPMPLELLTNAVAEAAIERVLRATRHLLSGTAGGWTIFHNSFRQFILAKPRIRLGRPDPEHSARIYRELAGLARIAAVDTPQRWFELRYLARAEDHSEVIALAQPSRFRDQLAGGRPISELYVDVRLAFASARNTHDATLVARLLLIHDEIDRRSRALEYATCLPGALLGVGNIDAAEAFVEEFPGEGYQVVDRLIQTGQFERAEQLFEKLEPLSQLLEGKFRNRGIQENVADFEKWAHRVHHFRDAEHINEAIEHLSVAGLGHVLEADANDTSARIRERLRYCVARAILRNRENLDPEDVREQYQLDVAYLTLLFANSGIWAYERGNKGRALDHFRRAINLSDFLAVPDRTRRRMAFCALGLNDPDLAARLFDELKPPSLADLGGRYDSDEPRNVTADIVEYARLATRLKRSFVGEAAPCKSRILQPLQAHATAIGVLMGKVEEVDGMPAGEVTSIARAAMSYLARAKAIGSEEFFPIHQLEIAAPVICRSLINVAARCGSAEFENVLAEIDKTVDTSSTNPGATTDFRRELALAIYQATGDQAHAASRLEQLRPALLERTPSEQIDELSQLAAAFARIGRCDRARELIGEICDETLGYAAAPKKDPLYAVWRDLLVSANDTDPGGRKERLCILMRQVSGMEKTEGSAAAERIAFELVTQSTLHSPAMGIAASRELSRLGLIGWPNIVDNLLKGLVQRREDLVVACAVVWCRLSLPYYLEPHYRYPERVGDFIDVAMSHAPQEDVPSLTAMFRENIEVEARIQERHLLLQRTEKSARLRGHVDQNLTEALERWQGESPPPRHSYTPSKFDEVTNLVDLKTAFERENTSRELGYEAPRAFARLARSAGFQDAREIFEHWRAIHNDARARFVLFDLAIKAGEREYAQKLLQDYGGRADTQASWTAWFGGYSREYFRAAAEISGAAVHEAAYEDFVDSVLAGRENSSILMAELDELIPVLTAEPDWRAIWDLFAEQIAVTREFNLGLPFDVPGNLGTEEEALSELLCWAYEIPVPELRRQAQLAALGLLKKAGGSLIFELVVTSLMTGKRDCPLHGAELLLLDGTDATSSLLGDLVASAVNHPDYAVAELADAVAQRWKMPVAFTPAELPIFYSLDMDDASEQMAPHSLLDSDSGAMRVESVRGWTEMFHGLVQMLQCPEVTDWQVQLRCRTLIAQWGGLAKFGPAGTTALQGELRRLDMAIGFERPHMAVAARALRLVASELRRAGLIADEARPYLLHQMGYSIRAFPTHPPTVRPSYVPRPTLPDSYSKRADSADLWLGATNADTALVANGYGFILAEASVFEIRKFNDAIYGEERLRVPRLDAENDDSLDAWLDRLPMAYWIEGMRTKNGDPSPFFVSRLSIRYLRDIPKFRLIICPNWLRILGWRSADENWSHYEDGDSVLMAQTIWWRDGGPVDVHGDATWGEGVVVLLTTEGRRQLEEVVEIPSAGTDVRRFVRPSRRDIPGSSRVVHFRD
jgi:hypothetical protein